MGNKRGKQLITHPKQELNDEGIELLQTNTNMEWHDGFLEVNFILKTQWL